MSIIKLCGLGVISVASALIVKKLKPDFAVFVSLAAAIVILGASISTLTPVISYVEELSDSSGFGIYTETIIKSLAVTVLAQTTGDICRDCGESAVAGKIEFAAKCAIMLLSLPVIKNILSLSEAVLGK